MLATNLMPSTFYTNISLVLSFQPSPIETSVITMRLEDTVSILALCIQTGFLHVTAICCGSHFTIKYMSTECSPITCLLQSLVPLTLENRNLHSSKMHKYIGGLC